MSYHPPVVVAVVSGQRGCRREKSLLVSLGQLMPVACVAGEMIVCSAAPPELLICSAPAGSTISSDGTLALIAGGQTAPPKLHLHDGAMVIYDGASREALEYAAAAAERGLNTVSCGLSASDDITLSSIEESSAVIALNRPVTDLNGCMTLPFELPISCRLPEPEAALYAAAVLLLSGRGHLLPRLRF